MCNQACWPPSVALATWRNLGNLNQEGDNCSPSTRDRFLCCFLYRFLFHQGQFFPPLCKPKWWRGYESAFISPWVFAQVQLGICPRDGMEPSSLRVCRGLGWLLFSSACLLTLQFVSHFCLHSGKCKYLLNFHGLYITVL